MFDLHKFLSMVFKKVKANIKSEIILKLPFHTQKQNEMMAFSFVTFFVISYSQNGIIKHFLYNECRNMKVIIYESKIIQNKACKLFSAPHKNSLKKIRVLWEYTF